jgi:uncharacterized membrane protein
MESWNVLLGSHVIAALFVLAIGPVQILRRRRDRIHRTMGYLWAASMYYVCFSSFWIVSDGHFSWLHGLSAFTIVTVTLGLVSAIRGNIKSHLGNMVGSYVGIAVAFIFVGARPLDSKAPGGGRPHRRLRGGASGPQRGRDFRVAQARSRPEHPTR